jgi:hypothetical protein
MELLTGALRSHYCQTNNGKGSSLLARSAGYSAAQLFPADMDRDPGDLLIYTDRMNRPTTLERAFELADQGYPTLDIRQILVREGYDQHQVVGSVLKALSKRINAAKARKN